MNRRGFLQAILAAGVAPAFVGSGVLMPVRELWTPRKYPFDQVTLRRFIPLASIAPLREGDVWRDGAFAWVDVTMTVEEYMRKYARPLHNHRQHQQRQYDLDTH